MKKTSEYSQLKATYILIKKIWKYISKTLNAVKTKVKNHAGISLEKKLKNQIKE